MEKHIGDRVVATATATLRAFPDQLGREQRESRPPGRLLSSLRLKAILAVFILLLIVALSGLIFLLVTRIFDELRPSLEADIAWKARRGAVELSQSLDLAMAVGDETLIRQGLTDYAAWPDVMGIVVANAKGNPLVVEGRLPNPPQQYLRGRPGEVQRSPGHLFSWAESRIEGQLLGKVAVLISTARLEAGDRLRLNILKSAALGGVAALAVSLFFVSFFLGPLITLSQDSVRTMQELEIAKRIQISILPRGMALRGMEASAIMRPAKEVGGDYYDVIPSPNGGCWIAIGDVAGHGVQAGLIMLMLQSGVSALVRQNPNAAPGDVLLILNEVLVDNIRIRMRTDEHVTFSLIRFEPDGRFVFAGAHEEILLFRGDGGPCERIPTVGAWLGASTRIRSTIRNRNGALKPGDLMVLYTDGVTEAKNATGELFGLDRLCELIDQHRDAHPELIRDLVTQAVATWSPVQEDDFTLLAIRHQGVAPATS